MIVSRIVRRGMGFLIEADGQLLPPYAYISYQPAKARYADFRAAGVKLFSTGVYAGDRGINPVSGIRPFRPGFWLGPNEFDFSAVDEDFRLIVGDAQPGEAFLLPRLMLDPPRWWEDAHPEALCMDAQGTPIRQSFCSPVWLEACRQVMRRFQAWLLISGWDRYVLGWHLAGGSTEEFIRHRTHPGQYDDYSDCAIEAFRDWLKERYPTAEALSAAWGRPIASFDDVQPPTPAQRRYARLGALRKLPEEGQLADFYRFHSDSVARAITSLARAAKEITGGRQIMGAFYGYLVNISDPELGHHAMETVLKSADVDFFASPFTYMENRAQGMDWPFQGAVESAHLHGKPWFMEADVRTVDTRTIRQCMTFADPVDNDSYEQPVWHGPDSVAGSLGQMGKAFARVLTHGTAAWWFDMWGGWYARPEFMDFHRKARALYECEALAGHMRPAAQIAVFIDEHSFGCVQPGHPYASQLVYQQLRELGHVGAPYHTYLMSDFERVSPDAYRMALLLAPLSLTTGQREALSAWKTGGRTLLFVGPVDLHGDGPGGVTGMDARIDGVAPVQAHMNGTLFPSQPVELPNVRIAPAAGDVVLATLADGAPATVLRSTPTHQILFSLAPALPAALVREAALLAGTHIYNFSGDVIYANSDYVAIHAHTDGSKRIYLPRRGQLEDAFTGEKIQGLDSYSDFRMAFGETRLFRVIPRNALPE